MKKLLLGAVVALSLALVACKKEDTNIKVAVSADYPPYMFFDEENNKKLTGFEIDMFDEIAKRIKKTVKYEDMDFDKIFDALSSKKVDVAMASISITKDRESKFDFSAPYISTGYAFVVKDPSLKSVDDIATKSIGIQSGTSYEEVFLNDVSAVLSDAKAESVKDQTNLLQKLKGDFIAAIFTGKSEAVALATQHKELHVIAIDLKDDDHIGLAFNKESAIEKEINAALSAMINDGTVDQIKKKWSIQ
ncbi:MAG: L-cystine-binding protein FliY [Holosporales bacterium]